jgi:hypothetical protein
VRGKYFLIKLAAAVIILSAFCFLFPMGDATVRSSVSRKNLSAAKQLALAAKMYAGDYRGKYPTYLNDLVPDYLADLNHVLYSEMTPANRFAPKYDWLYFAAGHDESHLPHIIIASPQAVTRSGENQRIVVYADQSAWAIREDQYQREVHQMIDNWRKTPEPSHPGPSDSGGVPNHSGEKATAP